MDHELIDLVIQLGNLFAMSAIEGRLNFDVDLKNIAHRAVSRDGFLGEFDDLTDAVLAVSDRTAC